MSRRDVGKAAGFPIPVFFRKVFPVLFFFLVLGPSSVSAYTEVGRVGSVAYSLYGPSWIWQRNDVNALFVFQNPLQEEVTLFLELRLSDQAMEGFEYSGPITQGVSLLAGQEKRAAYVGIRARDDSRTGTYQLNFIIRGEAEAVPIEYPVKVIRGPVVAKGLLPFFLPVGMALVWCLIIGVTFPRYGEPGAWKRPSKPYSSGRQKPEAEESSEPK